MKPRLIKFLGIWHCGTRPYCPVGVGYTPLQAYDDWLLLELKA